MTKKKNQTTVIVIVVILVLAVAGVLIWGFTSNWGQWKSSLQKAREAAKEAAEAAKAAKETAEEAEAKRKREEAEAKRKREAAKAAKEEAEEAKAKLKAEEAEAKRKREAAEAEEKKRAEEKKKDDDSLIIDTYTKLKNQICENLIKASESDLLVSDKALSKDSNNNLVLTKGTLADAIKKCNRMKNCVGVNDWRGDGLPNFEFCSSKDHRILNMGPSLAYIKP